jgi:hypothetical protein
MSSEALSEEERDRPLSLLRVGHSCGRKWNDQIDVTQRDNIITTQGTILVQRAILHRFPRVLCRGFNVNDNGGR